MKHLYEGLLDVFKIRKKMVELQGAVADEYEAAYEKNPQMYKNAGQLVRSVQQFAEKKYHELFTKDDDVISFGQWWNEWSESTTNFLNQTLFKK